MTHGHCEECGNMQQISRSGRRYWCVVCKEYRKFFRKKSGY